MSNVTIVNPCPVGTEGNIYLVERLTDVNPIPVPQPNDMMVLPTDLDYINNDPLIQEDITEAVIKAYPDYVSSVNPIVNLHSKMNNSFYRGEMDALYDEAQNLINYSSRIKFINDLDYFDGDSNYFYDIINNFLVWNNFNNAPVWFASYVNQEIGDAIDITKKHDYLRNLMKHVYLLRRWAGTLNGYKTTFRMINRLGAVHLNTIYSTGAILALNTDRKYRLLDLSRFNAAIPGASGSKFPNSPHILGTDSIKDVQGNSLYWDTGHTWDETNLTWDETTSFMSTGKGIFFEISLDRLLNHTNSIGTKECLIEDYYMSAIDNLLPEVQRASDDINVGAQITLVNSKDGRYNTLSGLDLYSHPNIHARSQVMRYRPDRITPAWTGASYVSYIKVGTGAYDPTTSGTYNPQVFVKAGENPADPSKIIPTDISNPVYESSVSVNERINLGNGYELVNVAIHPRSFVNKEGTYTFNVNGINVDNSHMKVGGINLVHTAITEGSLVYAIKVEIKRAYSITINSVSGATAGTITILGQSINLSASNIASTTAVASAIASNTFEGWDVSSSTNVVTFTANSPSTDRVAVTLALGTATNITFTIVNTQPGIGNKSVFHKVLMTQKINPITNIADPRYTRQKLYSDGMYYEVSNDQYLHGFTNDSAYSLPTASYFPTANDDSIILKPLYGMDRYAFFDEDLVGKYILDSTSYIPDSVGGTLYSQSAWATTDSWTGSNVTLSVRTGVPALVASITGINNPNISRAMSLGSGQYVRMLVNASIAMSITLSTSIGGSSTTIGTYALSTSDRIIDVQVPAGAASNLYITFDDPVLNSMAYFEFIYVGNGVYSNPLLSDYSDNGNNATFYDSYLDVGLVNKMIVLRNNASYIRIATSSSLRAATSMTISFIANFANATSGILLAKVMASGTPLWSLATNGTTVTFTANRQSGAVGTWTSNSFSLGRHIVTLTYNYLETAAPAIRIDGVNLVMTGSISGVLYADSDSYLSFGTFGSSVGYVTDYQEIRVYNGIMAKYQIQKLESYITTRLTALTTSEGNSVYFYLDPILGTIAFKAQYDPNGILNSTTEAQIDHSLYTASIVQSYDVNATSNKTSAITEMGLFDIDKNLVAYATFPPIIYNASKHHISFNFLVRLS